MLRPLSVSHGAPTLPFENVAARRFLEGLATIMPQPHSVLLVLAHSSWRAAASPMTFPGQSGHDKVRGGAPYGATTIAGGDGSRQPDEDELAGARYLGARVAKTAAKLAA